MEPTELVQLHSLNLKAGLRQDIVAIVGQRESGKTTLAVKLAKLANVNPENVHVFTDPTTAHKYKCAGISLDDNIMEEFCPDRLKFIVDEQRSILDLLEWRARANQANATEDVAPTFRQSLIIIDVNGLTAKALGNCQALRWVFMNGRCANLRLIVTASTLLELSPSIRSQIDLACVFPTLSIGKLHETLLSMLEPVQIQSAFKVLHRYEALVVDKIAWRCGESIAQWLFYIGTGDGHSGSAP